MATRKAKSNLPTVNFVFVRKAIVAASASAGIVRDLAANAEALAKDREAKLQAFYETVAAGFIASMRAQGSHASYAEDSDKLIAATVANVRKAYEDATQEHLDKAERKALATGRTYGSRNFAAAGIEHPFPRAKKGTGKKAAAKAEKPKAEKPKASAKVTAGAANVKPATGLKGADLDQNLREQLACFQRTFKGCAKDASEKARRAAELVAQAEKLLAAE